MTHFFILMLQMLTYGCSIISYLWAIIELLFYLLANKPFEWMSVWCILTFSGIGLILFILDIIFLNIDIKKRSESQGVNNNETNKTT